jgi:hypothetical protein
MATTNLPPNLFDYFNTMNQRLRKLESAWDGSNIELVNIQTTGFGGAIDFDLMAAPILFFTGNSTANGTINFRASAPSSVNNGTSTNPVPLSDIVKVGEAITCAVIITNVSTGYYPTALTIDGIAPALTVWASGVPTFGSAHSENVYSFTLTKLNSTPLWHCRAQVVTYA